MIMLRVIVGPELGCLRGPTVAIFEPAREEETFSAADGRGVLLSGQWVAFYALLASEATPPKDGQGWVTQRDLVALKSWSRKSPSSAGKEVARHIGHLEKKGLHALVKHDGRTTRWRLGPVETELLPSVSAVSTWLRSQRVGLPSNEESLAALVHLARGAVALQDGRTEEIQDVDLQDAADWPELAAWARVTRARVAGRTGDFDTLDAISAELEREAPSARGPLHAAVRARVRAVLAMDDRFENPQEGIRRLARIAASLDRAGDHATLAVVLHVLGVLKRRAGDPLEGASLHQRAATLAGLSDDHSTLQAALNNLALCRAIVVGSPDGTTLQLLDACLAVCAKFGVGGDSALAETTGAHWAMKTGDIEKARGYLDAAKAIIERLPSDYEQARFLAAQAEVTMASGGDRTSAIRDLRAAVRLFEASGDEPSAARARKRILCMRGRTS